jgi:hypothetical protein
MFRNWKTSLAGLGILATLGAHIAVAPSMVLADPSTVLTQAIAGLGLLLAKDFNKTGVGGL